MNSVGEVMVKIFHVYSGNSNISTNVASGYWISKAAQQTYTLHLQETNQ